MESQGQIVTFYSYKGGAGRSMALANMSWILASNGYGSTLTVVAMQYLAAIELGLPKSLASLWEGELALRI
jgi:MinD-like ATPase involved in chromosome partitioning or flagellar assembly